MRTVAIGILLGIMASGVAAAQPADGPFGSGTTLTVRPDHAIHRRAPSSGARPATVALDPAGFVQFQTPFTLVETQVGPALVRVPHYLGPDGSYDSPADLTQDINGIPCGRDCTARSLKRWGYLP